VTGENVELLRLVLGQHNVEDVVSAEQHVSVVREQLLVFAFCCAFKQNVHVSITFYHVSLILAAIFEDYFDVSMELFNEDV